MRTTNFDKLIPIADWLPRYQRKQLPGDLMAGLIVTIVLIPQAMAYAMLAGLPPQAGLYSCLLPILLYTLFGSSRMLAVGPVGLMSLMTAEVIAEMAPANDGEALLIAVTLALLAGLVLLTMRLFRFGAILNFLSHPVISGFSSAAALMIGLSQLKHLLGLDIPRGANLFQMTQYIASHYDLVNWVALTLGSSAIALLLLIRGPLKKVLQSLSLPPSLISSATKSGPLWVVLLSLLLSWYFELNQLYQLAIIGEIPQGLPTFSLPTFDWPLYQQLSTAALLIALIGYLESVSVGKALASRKRQKIDPNQELMGLGMANLGSALSGGYPVAGGFGRSMVNASAGANSQLASLITALLLGVTLIFLTPYLYYLPRAVLAAIIIIAVSALIDLKTLKQTWRYNRSDCASLIATFFAVLVTGLETGILFGAALSIALYLHRSSHPHTAIVGRINGSEHFRNIDRHDAETYPNILLLRIDENLYFANTNFLEDRIINLVVDNREIEQVVLICSSISFIDSSALESLETIIEHLRNGGVTLHFAEIKGPVMDQLKKTHFLDQLGNGKIFLSTHEAVEALTQ